MVQERGRGWKSAALFRRHAKSQIPTSPGHLTQCYDHPKCHDAVFGCRSPPCPLLFLSRRPRVHISRGARKSKQKQSFVRINSAHSARDTIAVASKKERQNRRLLEEREREREREGCFPSFLVPFTTNPSFQNKWNTCQLLFPPAPPLTCGSLTHMLQAQKDP